MAENVELLRAVAHHPDEDTPRLAYADWLDEHDQPERAAFIRLQVELANLKEDSPRRREVAFRCRQLLDANEAAWLDPLDAFVCDWRWARGFVEVFTTSPPALDMQDAKLFDTHPLRRVWVRELDARVAGLRLLPDNRITALDLSGNRLTTNAMKALAKVTHLPRLTELGLMFNDLRDTAVKVLCGEPFFQRLSLIRLGANPFTPAARDQLRAHFGDRVTFAHEREPDRLYTITDDYFQPGWGKDFTQLLVFDSAEGFEANIFDHAGNLLRTETELTRSWEEWLADLEYEPATIKVKRFRLPDGTGITDFNWWATAYDTPGNPQRGDLDAGVESWLSDGGYRYDVGGDDRWFAGNGDVTAT